jgi:single-strand DNA-binding protein
MYNKVLLIGNVVKDVETKSVKETSVSRFRIAVDDVVKKDSALYIDVEAWDKQSDFAQKWLKKGKGVIIDGRLCMDSWEKDGKKESKIYVKAQDIRFSNVGPKPDSETSSKQNSTTVKQNQPQQTEDDFSDVPF